MTTETQTHTPGPWELGPSFVTEKIEDEEHDGLDIMVRPTMDSGVIALVIARAGDRTEAQAQANALLIAQAPAMLAALQTAIADSDDTYFITPEPAWVSLARKIVALAEGNDLPCNEAEEAQITALLKALERIVELAANRWETETPFILLDAANDIARAVIAQAEDVSDATT